MRHIVQAACGCHIGKVRRNNEDNFYFDGKCLELVNTGLKHPAFIEKFLHSGLCFAIFDGMGGEHFGEQASYAAARQMQITERSFSDFLISESSYLVRMSEQMNDAVVKLQNELLTEHIGTTMVSLYFSGRYVYVCNVGDSRAYRLRNGEFMQLTMDHIERRPGREIKKAPLTQYLGFGSEDIRLEPYIAKGEFQKDDYYLLCSDGLTDMLTNFEISDIMLHSANAEDCVNGLIRAALEHGGRDNITVIVCRLI